MDETFSVWYFSNEALGLQRECECMGVSAEEAMKWFKHHISNVPAQLGFTTRVIIVDNLDMIVAEWKHGLGITWPEPELRDKP
jgi:hypothetical protein